MRARLALAVGIAALGAPVWTGCGDEGAPSETDAQVWEELPPPPLSPRENALGLWTGREVLVVGGSDAPPCPPTADCNTPEVPPLRDGAAFDPARGTWRPIASAPTGLVGAEGVVIDATAYVWVHGDPRRPGLERAFLAYRIDQDRWVRLPTPPGVGDQLHSLVVAGQELVLFRDSDEYGESPDLTFDPGREHWGELPPDPLSPSFDRALAWSGEELVLVAKDRFPGPNSPDPLFVSAAALDPRSGSWREFPDSQVLDMGLTGCWVEVDGRIVNPSVGSNDAGGRWNRPYPDGGVLDPETGGWSDLPERPDGAWDERYSGGILTGSEARCMSTEGWVLDAPAEQWLRVPALGDGLTQGRTVVGTDVGALAFGGVEWSPDEPRGRLVRDAWMWSAR